MATVKSVGLGGLPHYRASRVSTSMYEPIYLNLYTVQLTPPAGLGYSENDEEVLVVLEGLTKITFNTNLNPGAIQQTYKTSDRSFANVKPSQTYTDVATSWEMNVRYDSGAPESYTYKFLRQWSDLIYDPLTGRMSLKVDYVAPRIVVTIQDRAGTPFHQWILYNTFPTTALTTPQLDYTSNNLFKADLTFRCDFWDESVL